MMEYLIWAIGFVVGYLVHFNMRLRQDRKRLEAKLKRSQAAKKGRVKKVVDSDNVDPFMCGRKVNGSGMVDHE